MGEVGERCSSRETTGELLSIRAPTAGDAISRDPQLDGEEGRK